MSASSGDIQEILTGQRCTNHAPISFGMASRFVLSSAWGWNFPAVSEISIQRMLSGGKPLWYQTAAAVVGRTTRVVPAYQRTVVSCQLAAGSVSRAASVG